MQFLIKINLNVFNKSDLPPAISNLQMKLLWKSCTDFLTFSNFREKVLLYLEIYDFEMCQRMVLVNGHLAKYVPKLMYVFLAYIMDR